MSVYYYLEKTSTCSSSRSRSSSGSKLLCQRQKTWSLIISLTKARRKWFSQQNATLLLRILHTTDDAFFFPSFKEKLLLLPSRLCDMQKNFFFSRQRQWLLRMQKGEKEEERLTKLLKCSRVVPFYSRHLSEDWWLLLIFSQLFQFQAYLIRNEWLHSFSDDATITELWLNSFANIQSWTTYQQPSD